MDMPLVLFIISILGFSLNRQNKILISGLLRLKSSLLHIYFLYINTLAFLINSINYFYREIITIYSNLIGLKLVVDNDTFNEPITLNIKGIDKPLRGANAEKQLQRKIGKYIDDQDSYNTDKIKLDKKKQDISIEENENKNIIYGPLAGSSNTTDHSFISKKVNEFFNTKKEIKLEEQALNLRKTGLDKNKQEIIVNEERLIRDLDRSKESYDRSLIIANMHLEQYNKYEKESELNKGKYNDEGHSISKEFAEKAHKKSQDYKEHMEFVNKQKDLLDTRRGNLDNVKSLISGTLVKKELSDAEFYSNLETKLNNFLNKSSPINDNVQDKISKYFNKRELSNPNLEILKPTEYKGDLKYESEFLESIVTLFTSFFIVLFTSRNVLLISIISGIVGLIIGIINVYYKRNIIISKYSKLLWLVSVLMLFFSIITLSIRFILLSHILYNDDFTKCTSLFFKDIFQNIVFIFPSYNTKILLLLIGCLIFILSVISFYLSKYEIPRNVSKNYILLRKLRLIKLLITGIALSFSLYLTLLYQSIL